MRDLITRINDPDQFLSFFLPFESWLLNRFNTDEIIFLSFNIAKFRFYCIRTRFLLFHRCENPLKFSRIFRAPFGIQVSLMGKFNSSRMIYSRSAFPSRVRVSFWRFSRCTNVKSERPYFIDEYGEYCFLIVINTREPLIAINSRFNRIEFDTITIRFQLNMIQSLYCRIRIWFRTYITWIW